VDGLALVLATHNLSRMLTQSLSKL